jgi:hypothetical protein
MVRRPASFLTKTKQTHVGLSVGAAEGSGVGAGEGTWVGAFVASSTPDNIAQKIRHAIPVLILRWVLLYSFR